MAKKRKKGHKMTLTEKYNRLATGMKYFGEDVPLKKRASTKGYKALQKAYQKIRKAITEQGIDLPNIAQIAKTVIETITKPKEPAPQPEIREPLDYANEDEIVPIDFSSNTLDAFMDNLQEAMNELAGMYGDVPQIWRTLSEQHADIIRAFNTLRAEMGDNNLADYIENSIEYDALITITRYSYNEAVEILDNILDDLTGVVKQAQEYHNEQQFIPQTNINLDNL